MSRKRKRRKKGFMLVIIEYLLGAAILFGIFVMVAYFVCPLKKVTVEGTDLYTKDEITGYILDDKYSGNAMYAFIKNKLFPKGDAEFIDSFDVELTGRNSLKIICNEKKILGYIHEEDGMYEYFNYSGKIVEISETFVDRGYMKVEGVSCEEPQVGKKLSIGDEQIGYLTSLIKLLHKNDLMPNVVSYDENGRITLGYDDYNIALGSSVYLEEKIDRAMKILPQLEGLHGTLHLEKYSSSSTDIVFEKEK
jgi:cell division protein FtsQ